MSISESTELSTWSASEIEHAKQPAQIRKLIIICRLIGAVFTIVFGLAFFGGGIYLKSVGIIPEETLLIKILGLGIFLILCIPLYLGIKYATISISSTMRIMPKKLARVTLENQRLSIVELAALLGVISGT